MSLSLDITRLAAVFPNKVFFQWDLINPLENGTYLFDVYRSGSPNGPWDSLVLQAANIYHYVDTLNPTAVPPAGTRVEMNELSLSRGIYYRVVATPPSGSVNQVEKISIIEPRLSGKQRLLKRKILRDASVMLAKLNGVEVAVCKRRHWGNRCPNCFDKRTKEVVRSNCPSCLGTGFEPGYFTPVVTMARRGTAPVTTTVSPQGKTDIVATHVTILDLPRIEENDVLVFLRDNTRYVVKEVLPTELLTVVVHQKLMVSELARSSPEYRIKVDVVRIPPLF